MNYCHGYVLCVSVITNFKIIIFFPLLFALLLSCLLKTLSRSKEKKNKRYGKKRLQNDQKQQQ